MLLMRGFFNVTTRHSPAVICSANVNANVQMRLMAYSGMGLAPKKRAGGAATSPKAGLAIGAAGTSRTTRSCADSPVPSSAVPSMTVAPLKEESRDSDDSFALALKEELERRMASRLCVPLKKDEARKALRKKLSDQNKLLLLNKEEVFALANDKKPKTQCDGSKEKRKKLTSAGDSSVAPSTALGSLDLVAVPPRKRNRNTASQRLQANYYYRKARDFDARVKIERERMESRLKAARTNPLGADTSSSISKKEEKEEEGMSQLLDSGVPPEVK